MAYAPSPRPTFSEATPIPFASVTRHLWGDPEAGEVADWIYASTDKIHQLLFGIAPGGAFRHSDNFRTIFAADEVLYVLSGVMVLANPERGEVHRLMPGDAAFFRRDTWHHAFNHSSEPVRVLEYFAPPPSQGTSGAYAQTKPNLVNSKYVLEEAHGRWPMERDEIERNFTIRVMREADMLWQLSGEQNQVLVGLLASTEHLMVGKMILQPGQHSDIEIHDGDECLYVVDGTLNMHAPEKDGPRWFELSAQDGFFVPAGTPHQYYNVSGKSVTLLFGVAPNQ